MIGNSKLSTALRESNADIANTFKDSYVFDFLNLPETFNESDLQKGLIQQMKNFILELGRDFLFISEEYKLQVGNSDFFIDLLFFHRGLQCLVAFELKVDKFKPEHLGQLNFYLEALDRDVKRQNENPSIGILLCKDKDSEVVEYALSRSLSPTMVSE
ncbi:PDDEXK nuclease domain-containing protein [Epilithonimonas ginsengisoli]|uniref:PDDEXK nuclease domain-containing protein n=1 Tax=Epilithonimonas ginsengisoli TaxID=1245592 RepID=A0ABU4JK70_9FLAO|nr:MULTISPECIES: PDDEXK nuclease domain-containing protein [Chryseobacterium group]MDW8550007.1 PDDEXK nuclease domain-containing protein [Epilithonimonas ginsengisoli]